MKPVGTLTCATDLSTFVENLFCEVEGLQCLCQNCHDIKTQKERVDKKLNKLC